MNNLKQLVSLVALTLALPAFAQLPVSQTAEKRNVVLEEFTGKTCQYCPDGHKIAQEIKNANPKDVFIINIHTGGYASGTPNYTTSFGADIATQADVQGYPAGCVNRKGAATYRDKWKSEATAILGQASYVNVALQAGINPGTREMVVDVELYFTANGASSVNLNVALLQNNVEGPQTGGSTYNPSQVLPNGKYNHMHMLRHLLTGQWGEVINTTTAGSLVKKQYKYTLPANINNVPLDIKNLELVAFVAEGNKGIISGNTGPITTAVTSAGREKLASHDVAVFPNPASSTSAISFTSSSSQTFQLEIYNALGELVYTRKPEPLSAGKHSFAVDVHHLSNGLYFASVSLGDARVIKKINVFKQ